MDSKATTGIAALVVGLLVGGGIGYAVSMGNMDDMSMANNQSASESQPNSNTKAAELRANLTDLAVEHMDLTYAAVASALQGSESSDADSAALVKNGEDVAAAFGSVYGEEAQATVDKVWKIHLTEFTNYAVASAEGDEEAKQAALDTIDEQYTRPLAAYLGENNPNLTEDGMYEALNGHIGMTAVMIDNEASGNWTEAQNQRQQAVDMLSQGFSGISDAIVKQFPEKF